MSEYKNVVMLRIKSNYSDVNISPYEVARIPPSEFPLAVVASSLNLV